MEGCEVVHQIKRIEGIKLRQKKETHITTKLIK